jgi:type IV secretory pathway VirB10-like protein
MATKLENMKEMMGNPKARLGFFMTIGALIFAVVAASLTMGRGNKPQATVKLGATPELSNQPGTTNNAKYAEAVASNNSNKFNDAENRLGDNKNGTALPTPVQLDNKTPVLGAEVGTSLGSGPKPVEQDRVSQVEQMKTYQAAPIIPQVQYQQVQYTQPVQSIPVQQAYVSGQFKGLDELTRTLFDRWSPTGQTMETDYTGGRNGANNANNGNQVAAAQRPQDVAAANTQAAAPAPKLLIQAGTFYPAQLITGVDTDEPGPVIAEILSGPAKGAKVMGQTPSIVNNNAEKVTLQFATMTGNMFKKSMAIQAYAVNPDSSKFGLATEVDHHYLLRFGGLLASSFISGYGQALQQSGAVTTVNQVGGTVTSTPVRSSSDITKIALGQVGQSVGQAMQQGGVRPTTIKVAPRTPVGILFMQDVFETAQ